MKRTHHLLLDCPSAVGRIRSQTWPHPWGVLTHLAPVLWVPIIGVFANREIVPFLVDQVRWVGKVLDTVNNDGIRFTAWLVDIPHDMSEKVFLISSSTDMTLRVFWWHYQWAIWSTPLLQSSDLLFYGYSYLNLFLLNLAHIWSICNWLMIKGAGTFISRPL